MEVILFENKVYKLSHLIFINTTEIYHLETKCVCFISEECVPRSKHYPPQL